ncbi:MAG: 4'-phosphopantetheinyl transferase superfamily protein [Muribaculaceae bacterium]|nr:4'-phosphopantetheinyl transferase superfamily protein [Muribaculaceae bacterium]
METEFIYWRHRTPVGVKVEEISGGEGRSAVVWRAMACQVWKENGHDGYRELEHLECGTPLLWGEHTRISITHTTGLYVVASLPPTPEADLEVFSERTALGVDAERADRNKVLNVRQRYLTTPELEMIPEDDLAANVTAWTCKEAMIKASLNPSIDWHNKIVIDKLPTAVPIADTAKASAPQPPRLGAAHMEIEGREISFILYSYRTGEHDEYIVTIAITPRTATYSKEKNQTSK